MRKLFTAKPGKTIGLFLLLGIVALQWSFTPAVTGENRTALLLTDTSTTPVAGTGVATKKPASARSNRTATTSKPALAANLERETISFGSPTGGPNTETSTPRTTHKKTAVMGSAKAADVKAADAKGAVAKPTDKKNIEKKTTDAKVTDTKATDSKAPDAKSSNTKSVGIAISKNEGTANTKVAPADKKSVEEVSTNIINTVLVENTGTVDTKTAGTAATRKADAGSSKKMEGGSNEKVDAASNKKVNAVSDKKAEAGSVRKTDAVSNEKVNAGTRKTGSIGTAKTSDAKSTTPKTTGTISTKPTSTADKKNISTAGAKTLVTAASTKTASSIGILSKKLVVYDSLHLKRAGLSKKVFTMALTGMSKLVSGRHIKDNLLAIVDFSQPSNKKRLYVIDLNNYQLLYNTYVAHGMKSGRAMAQSFSNKPASEKSSLGFFVTGPAYKGTNGYSLRLTGVEKGINDHAMDRGIVIHGADYVCEGLIESQGFIGRSFGCPAVAQEISQELIDLLKEGSCLFIYHPSPGYNAKSLLIK